MGVDALVMLPCEPKLALGGADPDRGGVILVELLKKRGMLAEMRLRAGEEALPEMVIRVHGGTVLRTFTGAELIADTAPLEALGGSCASCPANGRALPFGCWTHLRYPISAAAEEWLVSRVEAADRVGGKLMLQQLGTGSLDGEPMAALRRASRSVFAAEVPARRVLVKGWLRSTEISSDQLWHALLGRGPIVDPDVGLLILLWLGAVSIDGRPPPEIDDAQVASLLLPTTVEQRFRRTDLDLGAPSTDESTIELRFVLRSLYVSWIVGVPTWLNG